MPCPIWVTNQDVSGGTYSGVWAVEQVAGKGCFAIDARLPSTTNREISGPAAQAPASRLTMLPRAIQRAMRNILLIVALAVIDIDGRSRLPYSSEAFQRHDCGQAAGGTALGPQPCLRGIWTRFCGGRRDRYLREGRRLDQRRGQKRALNPCGYYVILFIYGDIDVLPPHRRARSGSCGAVQSKKSGPSNRDEARGFEHGNEPCQRPKNNHSRMITGIGTPSSQSRSPLPMLASMTFSSARKMR